MTCSDLLGRIDALRSEVFDLSQSLWSQAEEFPEDALESLGDMLMAVAYSLDNVEDELTDAVIEVESFLSSEQALRMHESRKEEVREQA